MVEQFARLPGIGHKTAQRLAFFVLSLPEGGRWETFAQSILEAKRTIAPVSRLPEPHPGGGALPHLRQ